MSTKVQNPQQIQSLASDVVRYLGCGDERAITSFVKLNEVGADSPSYTRLMLRKAQYDHFDRGLEDFKTGEISYKDFITKAKQIGRSILKLWESDLVQPELKENYRKFYPKTGIKRLAIETCLTESSKYPHQLCSKKKGLKKYFYFMTKMLVK